MTARRVLGRSLVLAVVVVLAVAIGATASAFWTAGGAGTGSGTAATIVPVTLSPGIPSATLTPGGSSNVVLTVSNPNTVPVRFGSLSLAAGQGVGGFSVDSGHSGCSVASLSFVTQTNSGAGWTVPKKIGATNGTIVITLPNAIAMAASAANACQGATATVYLSVAQ